MNRGHRLSTIAVYRATRADAFRRGKGATEGRRQKRKNGEKQGPGSVGNINNRKKPPVPGGKGKPAEGGLLLERRNKAARTAVRKVAREGLTQRSMLAAAQQVDLDDPSMRPFVELAAEMLREREQDAPAEGASRRTAGRGRGARKAVWHDAAAAHGRVFRAALQAELAEEWAAAEERLTSWPKARLQDEGLALFGMSVAPDGALYRDSILRFRPAGPPDTPLPNHSFSPGDIVLISQGQPGDSAVEGVVMDYSTRWLRVAVAEDLAGAVRGRGPWRLDLYANTVAHERCMEALSDFAEEGSEEAAVPLRRLLLGIDGAEAAAVTPPWTRGAGRDALKQTLKDLRSREGSLLNPSQLRAVEAALGRTLTLWQGPPGTGKTRTLLAFVAAAVALLRAGGNGKVLAVAGSNVAVDAVAGGLAEAGVRVVRVGQPVKVAEHVREVTLEALIAKHPAGKAAAVLRENAARLRGPAAADARENALRLELQATEAVLAAADVVAATCIGAGDPRLAGLPFRIAALDEACQSTEPGALVPLALGGCAAALLVGDPAQLPPTVVSQTAASLGLGVSLFERLQRGGIEPFLLDVQYRMHPGIAAFPAAAFYGGRLTSHPTPAERPMPIGFPWPKPGIPVAFVDTLGSEQRSNPAASQPQARLLSLTTAVASTSFASPGEGRLPLLWEEPAQPAPAVTSGTSYFNAMEAEAVCRVVRGLVAAGSVSAAEIGVITPYNGQVREIRRLLQASVGAAPLGSSIWRDLEIRSVDGFQGREKEVIVFSAVRANTRGALGFLVDARRLNVALTRARRGLLLVGCRRTLANDATWRAWLEWVDARGLSVKEEVLTKQLKANPIGYAP